MKKGDSVRCNSDRYIDITNGFLYKIIGSTVNGVFMEVKDDFGNVTLVRKDDFDLYKPSKTGWQQMQEAAGVKVDFITPTCDFGCKYAFGNEHLEGCSLTGEIK